MKKILLISVILAAMLLSACGAPTSGPTTQLAPAKQEPTLTPKPVTLTDVVRYFKEQGLEVGEIVTKAFSMMGAVDGFGIYIEGEQIELYLFDPETADDETLRNLQDAQSIGKFSAFGFSFPVVMNGDIMLTRYDEHTQKDRIIKIFKQFR